MCEICGKCGKKTNSSFSFGTVFFEDDGVREIKVCKECWKEGLKVLEKWLGERGH